MSSALEAWREIAGKARVEVLSIVVPHRLFVTACSCLKTIALVLMRWRASYDDAHPHAAILSSCRSLPHPVYQPRQAASSQQLGPDLDNDNAHMPSRHDNAILRTSLCMRSGEPQANLNIEGNGCDIDSIL